MLTAQATQRLDTWSATHTAHHTPHAPHHHTHQDQRRPPSTPLTSAHKRGHPHRPSYSGRPSPVQETASIHATNQYSRQWTPTPLTSTRKGGHPYDPSVPTTAATHTTHQCFGRPSPMPSTTLKHGALTISQDNQRTSECPQALGHDPWNTPGTFVTMNRKKNQIANCRRS